MAKYNQEIKRKDKYGFQDIFQFWNQQIKMNKMESMENRLIDN
jgi:hypothetical protein